MLLTNLEKSLLGGAFRANAKIVKWAMYFGYTVFLCAAGFYSYLFVRAGLNQALGRVIQCLVVVMVLHATRGYQSLIRKLYAAAEPDRKP